MTRCVHFIGFRGDEYHSACKAFGPPHFIHRWLDQRAFRKIDWDHDLIVFANKLKSDATLEEMRLVLVYMEKYIAG